MRRRFWIVRTGETLPAISRRRGHFEDWITSGLGLGPDGVEVVDVARGGLLPDPERPRAAIVTGSSSMVTDREPWSERTAAWLAGAVAAGTPILGICYGHQLLAHALGGEVAYNERGREIGTIELGLRPEAAEDPLFGSLPSPVWFQATHQQHVRRLPEGARWLAESDGDPHQAFAVGERAWGVQFHPEFDADVMRGYLEGRREAAEAEGIDVDGRIAAVREAPEGPRLLRRFRALAEEARP